MDSMPKQIGTSLQGHKNAITQVKWGKDKANNQSYSSNDLFSCGA